MRTIHKYPLRIEDEQEVSIPKGAELLCVQMQNGVPCLWAAVDTLCEPTPQRIFIRGTGHRLNGIEGRYLGTFQMQAGALVFHVFNG